jgi:hypothetical protein
VITPSLTPSWLDKIRKLFPASDREWGYRIVAAISTGLMAFGLLNTEDAALWTQLGVSVITTLFALLYSTSTWRSALYVVVGPIGGLLMAYGIGQGVNWAIIVSAVGQLFGIATAAAKTVQAPARALHQAP